MNRKLQYRQVVNIRLIDLFIVLILMISVASGYVRTSNTYFTEGGEVSEDMLIINGAYSNQVSIYQDSLFAAADAVLASNSQNGSFSDHILAAGDQGQGTFGLDIQAESNKQFDYHRSFTSGGCVNDQIALSYTLQSGKTDADYFALGGTAHEDIAVENVKYVNGAKIYPQSILGSGDADLVSGVGVLDNDILINSDWGLFGTKFNAKAEDRLNYEKSFAVGHMENAQANVVYNFEKGNVNVNYFNPTTNIDESIFTDACMFKGSIENAADELNSRGQGMVTKDAPSMFTHDIQMAYGGKACETTAVLNTYDGEYGYGSATNMPVIYKWNSFVNSDEYSAIDMISAAAYNGNRNADMQITGKAQGLTDKCAGPLYLTPLGFIGISKELYMSYKIIK